MTYDGKTWDSRLLDRMVDGELSPELHRQLLMACEEHPEQWRGLALRYIEAQTLEREFGQLCTDGERQPWRTVTTYQSRTGWRGALAMAATVLISVGIGFGIGSATPPLSTLLSHSPDRAVTDRRPERAIVENPDSAADTLYMLVSDGRSDELQPVRVPLMRAADIDIESWRRDRIVPANVRRALEQTGHRVEQNRRLYPYRLRDGRQVLVLIDDVQVRLEGYQ